MAAPHAFELFLRPHLEASSPRDEAARVVLELANSGRPFTDAVLDVTESLAAAKTRKLRSLISQFSDYEKWVAYERAGWSVTSHPFRPRAGSTFHVDIPKDLDKAPFVNRLAAAEHALPAVAAAVGVRSVYFMQRGPMNQPAGFNYIVKQGW